MEYSFRKIHKEGTFAELLDAEGNEELKAFFEDLFWIYNSDGKDSFELSQKAWSVKAYIMKNRHRKQQDDHVPFGFTPDQNTESTALFRLKAYIYYTRFCNLGLFLAERYYKDFPFSKEDRGDDFRLALNYFMLNDDMGQCVYTGVAYKFNIDFLPRRETFYRWNDGIEDCMVQKLPVPRDQDVFPLIAGVILNQIKGSDLRFYSAGKNFGQCLFKYYNPERRDWSLRVYEKVPVNYIQYNGRKYSIPAFLQIQETLGPEAKSIRFAIDMSCFRKGREGKETSSLSGFFKYVIGQEIVKERVATIFDGEIVSTQLPDCAKEYQISLPESMFLKKAYLDRKGGVKYKVDLDQARADYAGETDQARKALREMAMELLKQMKEMEDSHQAGEIIEIVNQHEHDIIREKNSSEKLIKLTPYGSEDSGDIHHNKLFDMIRKYLKLKEEGPGNGREQGK